MKAPIFVACFFLSIPLMGQSVARKLPKQVSYDELLTYVSHHFNTKEDIAEFFYYWMAQNISYDYEWAKMLTEKEYVVAQDALSVFESRKAVCSGYAILYKLLLNEFDIECEVVNGYAKRKEGLILSNELATSHSWNVFKLDDNWLLLDVTWASTMKVDGKVSSFYFKTPPEEFIYNHLPNIPYWQLLSKSISKDEFIRLPEVNAGYFDLGFDSSLPRLICEKEMCKLTLGKSINWRPVLHWSASGLEYRPIEFKKKNYGHFQELTFQPNEDGTFILRLDAYRLLDLKSEIVRTELAYVVVE